LPPRLQVCRYFPFGLPTQPALQNSSDRVYYIIFKSRNPAADGTLSAPTVSAFPPADETLSAPTVYGWRRQGFISRGGSPAAASSDLGSRWPSVVVAAAGCGFFTLLLLIIYCCRCFSCRSVHTHALAHSITLSSYTNPLTHIHARALSLSPLSFSLSRWLACSPSLCLSRTHVQFLSHTRLFTQTAHTRSLSESFVCSLSYLLSFACTLSISDVHICAIFHFLQTYTHQAHQLLAEWAGFHLNQFIFI